MKNRQLVKRVERILLEARTIPMWAVAPDFPWHELSERLKTALNLEELELSCEAADWKEEDQFYEKMGPHPFKLGFEMMPLDGTVEWVMGWSDLSRFISWTLEKGEAGGFVDEDLQKGYYQYLILQACSELQEIHRYGDLSLRLQEKPIPVRQKAYAIDVRIAISGKSVYGRLLCSSEFHTSFLHYFKERPLELNSYPLSSEILLNLPIRIGHVSLSTADWERVGMGDFILLDHCSYHLKDRKGIATLNLDGTSLINGRIREGSFKIIEFIPNQEKSMDSEEIEEENEEVGKEEEEEEKIFQEKLIKAEEISLPIKVEIGHLTMSLEKLLLLQPGNVIDLPFSPEKSVQLTVHGKAVARGELIETGEAVGVKITEINRG